MKKQVKKVLVLVLAVCMMLSIAVTAAAAETDGTKEPGASGEDSVSDLLDVSDSDPRTGEETAPFIAAEGEAVLLNKENELLLYTSNRYGRDDADEVDDFLHKYEKMDSNTSYKTDDAANNSAPAPALDLSYVTAVALDASGGGRDDYIAYLGVKAFDSGDTTDPNYKAGDKVLRLVLYNARTNTVESTLQLGSVKSWIDEIPHWSYKTFFSVTAGDYDGDGADEIACTDAYMDVQMVDTVKKDDTVKLSVGMSYNWSELVPESIRSELQKTVTASAAATRRAHISLATGNLDGTGAEELAVAVSSNHPGDEIYLPTVPEAYTTYVASVTSPMSTGDLAKRVRSVSVYYADYGTDEEEQKKPLYHHVVYSGQITAGDVNGDRKDEIVVAGYPGTIKTEEDGTIEEGPYELFGYDNEYRIVLCNVALDADKLTCSAFTKDDMTPFINEGFFDYHGAGANDFLVPLSVDAAKLHGQYGKESVFAGGTVYQLSTRTDEYGTQVETYEAIYTHEFFNTESSAGYTDAYVEHVTSGLFAGADPLNEGGTLYNEQFVFTVAEKENSFDDYCYKVGFIGMSTDADGVATFYDNTVTMNSDGHLLDERDGGVEEHYGTALVPVVADIDDDGLLVKLVGTSYYYEDPSVEVVLQAAPYFGELGDWNDFSGATTYSVSVSRSLVDLWGHSHSIHAGLKGKWGSDLTGELEAKIGYALDMDFQHEKSYTTTYTTTFEAGAYDTVVVQRTPYICYEYGLVDETGNLLTGEEAGSVTFMEAMQPVYFQLSVDEYNRFVDTYNEMADRHDAQGTTANGTPVKTTGDNYRLVKITEDILPRDTQGNPANYFSTLLDGQYISQGTYALSTNGGYTTSEFSNEVEESYSAVYAHGMHFEIEGVKPGLGFNVGGFSETSFQETCGYGNANMNGAATGGMVANINPLNYSAAEQQTLKKYGFNWRCALWKKTLMTDVNGLPYHDGYGNAFQVPVVGYVVTNVKSPMAAPDGVEAYLSGKGYQVTVDWNASPDSGDLLGYSVYRSYDNHEPVSVNEELLSPEATTFVDTAKLKPGKIYTYFVAAHYNSVERGYKSMYSDSSVVVWGIPLFDLSGEEGGDTPTEPDLPDSPGGSGENPGGSGENPGGTGENPGGTGENPGGTGENSGGTGENPGGSGENPGGSGENPGGTGENPGSTSKKELAILEQPEDVCVEIGEVFRVSVAAQGEDLSYQWYYRNAGAKSFSASGSRAAVYTHTMQSGIHERQVYCVITDADGNTVTTDTVTITRPPIKLEVLTQPQSVEVEVGQPFSVRPTVRGDGLSYQWYYKGRGMSEFAASFNKTPAYAYTMRTHMHERQVYCVITDAAGNTVTTDIATITRPSVELKILTQPEDVIVVSGERFDIRPEVQGEGLTYQWYYKEGYQKNFDASSNTTPAYAYVAQRYMDTRQVYCVITDQYGEQVTTDVVTIRVAQ